MIIWSTKSPNSHARSQFIFFRNPRHVIWEFTANAGRKCHLQLSSFALIVSLYKFELRKKKKKIIFSPKRAFSAVIFSRTCVNISEFHFPLFAFLLTSHAVKEKLCRARAAKYSHGGCAWSAMADGEFFTISISRSSRIGSRSFKLLQSSDGLFPTPSEIYSNCRENFFLLFFSSSGIDS